MNRDEVTIWGDHPRFELDPQKQILARDLQLSGDVPAVAAWNVNDAVVLSKMAIPRKILVHAGGPGSPLLVLGIEVRGEQPTCTYLELTAFNEYDVRAKHLKAMRLEEWVKEVVLACKDHVVSIEDDLSSPGINLKTYVRRPPPITREQAKAVERLQRRRRDPRTDHALLEQVSALYRQNPDAPNKAIASEFDVSERTAARWAGYCSDAGLLPSPAKQGLKRL